ncbi:hypothetical protein MASR2M44_14260 [Bacteroidota bacterium]
MKTWLKANLKYGISRIKSGKWAKKVLILSDDWGSIRLKDKASRNRLASFGLDWETNRFNQSDSLERNSDVERLLEVLNKYKDGQGKGPVFTLVANLGNPDFEQIQASRFTNFYVEDLEKTYRRTPGSEQVPDLFQQGISAGLFNPALHGREHVRTAVWLDFLKNGAEKAKVSFEEEFFFIPDEWLGSIGKSIEAPFWNEQGESQFADQMLLQDAMHRYAKFFAREADYFTPPALLFNPELPAFASALGLSWLDVPRNFKPGSTREEQHKSETKNLKYVIRNMVFDPNIPDGSGDAAACLYQMEKAFQFGQPAIISNHRVSFAGRIDEKNANHGLKELDILLGAALKRWPDLQFCGVEGLKRD